MGSNLRLDGNDERWFDAIAHSQSDEVHRVAAKVSYNAHVLPKQIQFPLSYDKLDTTARHVNDEQKFGGEAVEHR